MADPAATWLKPASLSHTTRQYPALAGMALGGCTTLWGGHLGLGVEGDGVDVVVDQGRYKPLHEASPDAISLPGREDLPACWG